MSQTTKNYRKELADLFIRVLEEKDLDWKKEWKGTSNIPFNAKSNAKYKGINRLRLMLVALEAGYDDPRWATYKQIQDMGYRLTNAKGKGVQVEYWFPYDVCEGHALSWEEFNSITGGKMTERYQLRASYSTVFNAAHIDGFPALEPYENIEVSVDELISKISKNMDVEIVNDGGDRAFYRPVEDKIHLPLPESFFSSYAYNATALHELGHATGHSSRLNRLSLAVFGSEEYAYEELIAEITSCFMSANLNMPQDVEDINNHKAYVQSWIKHLKEKPESLAKAVAEAEKATAFMEYKAELIPKFEYDKVLNSSVELSKESKSPIQNIEPKVAVPKL